MQRKPLKTLAWDAINTILPPRCVLSGEIVEHQGMLSGSAWGQLDFISNPYCKCCGAPFDFDDDLLGYDEKHCAPCLKDKPDFTMARAALVYNDASRNVILSFKHGDKTHFVKAFTPWLKKAGAEILENTDILIPVPLHRWRLLRRRYNQSALISHLLAQDTGMQHLPGGLTRTRATPTQGHLKTAERQKNVHRAFAVNPAHLNDIQGKTITLIDDVYTTGATAKECTKTLLKSGAKQVNILTLARVLNSTFG